VTGIDNDRARDLIRQLSRLPAGTVELLGVGTDSAAFRVDTEWVVRFPLVPEAQRSLRTELALLPSLARQLPVAVPYPEHIAEQDGRLVFSAYRALDGQPLSDAALSALAPSARTRALDELTDLLDAIHRFPASVACAAGVSLELCKGAYHPAQHALGQELAGMLDPSDHATIVRLRHAFDLAQQQGSTPVLLHADIKPAHLLHNPATGGLTGLLDWGDVSLGHPDFDLAIIGAFCGRQTLQGLLERMDPADAVRVEASLPFLLSIRWLQDISSTISRGGDQDLVDRGLRRLREHLKRAPG
jgi:aminoglycoside phosphotransferase (APT) family kinase protein